MKYKEYLLGHIDDCESCAITQDDPYMPPESKWAEMEDCAMGAAQMTVEAYKNLK